MKSKTILRKAQNKRFLQERSVRRQHKGACEILEKIEQYFFEKNYYDDTF